MAKKMIINCGNCDARNVSEETLAAYESITVNGGTVIVTPESKNLLNRYNVALNCGNVLELEKDVRLCSVNGSTQIKSTDLVPEKTYLDVNGSLEIGPGTEKVLEQYVGISVNGSVLYPESMSGCLGKLDVNGSTDCYPDDAILLKRSAVIDRLFALRAKNKCYWSAKRMVMVDPDLDPAALAAKGATFSAKEVILAESKVEGLIELIDEKAEIIIVPDGTAVVLDDLELDGLTVKKYGTKLYVTGDVKIRRESREALSQLEYLNIRGDVTVPGALKELLVEKAKEIAGEIKVMRGRYISDSMSVRVSKWMLEQEEEGLSIADCMKVRIDEDIPNEMILEKLSISDCMKVCCTAEQEAALAAVCVDVMKIGEGGSEGDDMGVDDLLKGVGDMVRGALGTAKDTLGTAKELLGTKIVNTGDYVL